MLKAENSELKIDFNGVAFGGHYGGHNVNIEISDSFKEQLNRLPGLDSQEGLDTLLAEVQRRILNSQMTVDFDTIHNDEEQKNVDPFGNISL